MNDTDTPQGLGEVNKAGDSLKFTDDLGMTACVEQSFDGLFFGITYLSPTQVRALHAHLGAWLDKGSLKLK